MKRLNNGALSLFQLGRATKLTKGSWGPYSDEQLMQLQPGLSRD